MTRSFPLVVVLAGVSAIGCTTLGPMPTTTGLSAVPAGRPGAEAQFGMVPGYLLSEGAQETTDGAGDPAVQLLGAIEPGSALGTGGLVVGARRWGRATDGAFEPFVGYRHRLDDAISIALIGYGTKMSGEDQGASYRAGRVGGELALDARMLAMGRWTALHGQASVSTTYVDASGTYCVDPDGLGTDCGARGDDRVVDGTVRGAFSAATASLSLDIGRRPTGTFHGLRIALLGAAGLRPQLRNGMQLDSEAYASLGLTMTLGFGAE
jgi:hypothetical protein